MLPKSLLPINWVFLNRIFYKIKSIIYRKYQRNVAGIVALDQLGRVLLIKDTLNRWKIPSGGIEKNEGSLDAAKREFLEETGYRISKISGILSITEFTKKSKDYYSFIYVGKVDTKVKPNRDMMTEDEVLEIKSFTKKQVANMQVPSVRSELIKKIILSSFDYKSQNYPLIFHRHPQN